MIYRLYFLYIESRNAGMPRSTTPRTRAVPSLRIQPKASLSIPKRWRRKVRQRQRQRNRPSRFAWWIFHGYVGIFLCLFWRLVTGACYRYTRNDMNEIGLPLFGTHVWNWIYKHMFLQNTFRTTDSEPPSNIEIWLLCFRFCFPWFHSCVWEGRNLVSTN